MDKKRSFVGAPHFPRIGLLQVSGRILCSVWSLSNFLGMIKMTVWQPAPAFSPCLRGSNTSRKPWGIGRKVLLLRWSLLMPPPRPLICCSSISTLEVLTVNFAWKAWCGCLSLGTSTFWHIWWLSAWQGSWVPQHGWPFLFPPAAVPTNNSSTPGIETFFNMGRATWISGLFH